MADVVMEEEEPRAPRSSTRLSATSKSNQSLRKSRMSLGKKGDVPEEFYRAKAFLKQASTVTNINLYDHLTDVLGKIIQGRPINAVDFFEDISLWVKRNRLHDMEQIFDEREDLTLIKLQAEKEKKLFTLNEVEDEEEEVADVSEEESILPNLIELHYYFNQVGIAINKDEILRIGLAMKFLVHSHPLAKIRLWGKILGMEKNYIIVETLYREGEDIEEAEDDGEEEEDEAGMENEYVASLKEDEEEGEEEEEEVLPKPKFKPSVEIPPEEFRVGTNKHVYFVCSEPGESWIRLPHVTPMQISIARKISKFFTGRLDAPVLSFPPFPGKEANYLRAQIARISAATHICPAGLYTFPEDEEEGAVRQFIEAEEFEPPSAAKLAERTMDSWVHLMPYILPQGRCYWYSPKAELEGEQEEPAEEDEEAEAKAVIEPEVGPPLLTPLSEDSVAEEFQIWSTSLSSKLFPKYSIADVRSNLWPGAHSFAYDKKFENIYIGYGVKQPLMPYRPLSPPPLMTEYPIGDDVTETEDPTPSEEAEFLDAGEEEEAVDIENENEADED